MKNTILIKHERFSRFMPTCEISGKDVPKTIRVRVEGVVMNVSPEFASMGKRLDPLPSSSRPVFKPRPRLPRPVTKSEPETMLVSDYSARVKQAREKRGLKQEDLAKMMMEKASIIHQVESGHLHPSDKLIAKFKKYLEVNLTQTFDDIDDDELPVHSKRSSKMTLGDLMKFKK